MDETDSGLQVEIPPTRKPQWLDGDGEIRAKCHEIVLLKDLLPIYEWHALNVGNLVGMLRLKGNHFCQLDYLRR